MYKTHVGRQVGAILITFLFSILCSAKTDVARNLCERGLRAPWSWLELTGRFSFEAAPKDTWVPEKAPWHLSSFLLGILHRRWDEEQIQDPSKQGPIERLKEGEPIKRVAILVHAKHQPELAAFLQKHAPGSETVPAVALVSPAFPLTDVDLRQEAEVIRYSSMGELRSLQINAREIWIAGGATELCLAHALRSAIQSTLDAGTFSEMKIVFLENFIYGAHYGAPLIARYLKFMPGYTLVDSQPGEKRFVLENAKGQRVVFEAWRESP